MNSEDVKRAHKYGAAYRYVKDHIPELINKDHIEIGMDPRFPSRRGDARCYQMFKDKLLCQRKHGTEPGTVCDFFVHRVNSLCPPSRVERWQEALESGKLFRV